MSSLKRFRTVWLVAAATSVAAGLLVAAHTERESKPAASYILTANVNFPVSSSIYQGPVSSDPSVGCSGASGASLYPGVTDCLRYSVENPFNVPIAVKALSISAITFSPSTTIPSLPACSVSDLATTPFAPTDSSDFLTVAAGSTAYLGEPISLTDDGNQDNCQQGTFRFTVNGSAQYTANTQIILVASSPAIWGQPVTLTATVSASTPVQGPPSTTPYGTVTYYECTNSGCTTSEAIGSSTVNSSGIATLSHAFYPFATSAAGVGFNLYAIYRPPAGTTDWNASPPGNRSINVGFTGCVSGKQNGLAVSSGQTYCVTGTGNVSGGVNVKAGGGLVVMQAGRVSGGLNASGAVGVFACGSDLAGGTKISSSVGPVAFGYGSVCPGNTVSNGLSASNNVNGWSFFGNTVSGGTSLSNNYGAVPTT